MTVSGFGRAKYSAFNAVAHSLQCWDESGELPVGVPRDVLAPETERPALIDDAENLIDEEPIVEYPKTLSGDAVSLAGITGSDAMNSATPRSSVEGGKVRPDRRRIQVSRFHATNQRRSCCGFPLHVSDCTRSGHGEFDSKSETACPGAELEHIPGT